VKDSFINDIISELKPKYFDMMGVLDEFTTINGCAGVTFIDKINRKTSAGNPFKKSKKFFIKSILGNENAPDAITFDDVIMKRSHAMEDKYKQGKRCMPNFCAHLKDEAVTFKKANIGKTRVFTGAPVDWSIVVRKYLLNMVRVLQLNKYVFESAPGTIAQSIEWQQIYEYLTKHGEDRIVAGDYKSFDKRMSPKLILLAFDILKALAKKSGKYSTEELRVIDGIAVDTAFPFVEFNGDFVQFFGSNPSGHPLTVVINGLVNSLYVRYCYYQLNPEKECLSFRKNVSLMTYGDDNIMGVSKNAPWFNHTTIAEELARNGVVYTMADKEADSVAYVNIREASFLKRSWKWDKDVQAFLCPLDHESIEKSLTVWVASKSVVWQEQILDIMSSAVREYFFYGKETYLQKKDMFLNLIKEHDLEEWTWDNLLPSYEQLKDEFWNHSKHFL
jgi:hypothetical protein